MTARALIAPAVLVVALSLFAQAAMACPFCNAVRPTFSQEREAADVVALGEVVGRVDRDKQVNTDKALSVRLRQFMKGNDVAGKNPVVEIPLGEELRPGALCLVLGTRVPEGSDGAPSNASANLRYSYRPVTETSYAYFARAPELRVGAAERLRYFARYLQHTDPAVADDAYLEFGHAPFDVVAQVADVLPLDRMSEWLLDDTVPQERKGFYGLALGLSRDPQERTKRREFLTRLVNEPQDDFRAGFGGVLGGFLLAAGVPGLDLIDSRYLANPASADGDVRSAQSALRFYHEYGKEIPVARQRESLRLLLRRPEFAAETIADLARWEDWESMSVVVALYDGPTERQPALRRSVVGYLTVCPLSEGADELAQLRKRDPTGVAEAEAHLRKLGGIR